jgi:predicted ATP-dependent endonuclease of OLD family
MATTLRPALRNEILRELDQTVFGQHLFDLRIQEGECLIKVTYNPKPEFYFELREFEGPGTGRNAYITNEAPGQYALEAEEYRHEKIENGRGRIHSWARRIEEDYKAQRQEEDLFEALRKEFTEGIDQSNLEGQFTDDEQEKLNIRLEEMEKRLEKVFEEKAATQQQINSMHEQIRKLKQSVEILDKRTWVLAALHRVLDIYKEVKASTGEVRELLNDVGNMLPAPDDESNQESN